MNSNIGSGTKRVNLGCSHPVLGFIQSLSAFRRRFNLFYFMKHFVLLLVAALCLSSFLCQAQNIGDQQIPIPAPNVSAPTPYAIVSRDANSSVWQRLTYYEGDANCALKCAQDCTANLWKCIYGIAKESSPKK